MTGDGPVLPPAGNHGGDGGRIASALGLDCREVVDLSASLNPFAPDVTELAREVLGRAGSAVLESYPDSAVAEEQMAVAIGVDPARLVLTNGAAEAIALVAAVTVEGQVVEPEFSLYRRHLPVVREGSPRWRSNPSNPQGRLAGAGEEAGVWDEAFFPLATGRWTRGDDHSWRIGSLTKLWTCPGLRLGYVIAPTVADAARIRVAQPAWAVNGLALALVSELLPRTDLEGWHRSLGTLRASFVDGLCAEGIKVTPTDSNWVLVELAEARARLAPSGVIVRDCSSFGLPGIHRVAVPRPKDLDRVLSAFAGLGAQA